jgi:hypothetical protein
MSVPDRKFDRCSDPFDGIGVVGLGGIGVTDGETMSFPFAPLDTLIGHISNESYESNSELLGVVCGVTCSIPTRLCKVLYGTRVRVLPVQPIADSSEALTYTGLITTPPASPQPCRSRDRVVYRRRNCSNSSPAPDQYILPYKFTEPIHF